MINNTLREGLPLLLYYRVLATKQEDPPPPLLEMNAHLGCKISFYVILYCNRIKTTL
jgi:hypothetical protein